MHGGYQCVAQLSLSQDVVFFLLFAAAFSNDVVPCVLKMLKLAQTTRVIPKYTVLPYCVIDT